MTVMSLLLMSIFFNCKKNAPFDVRAQGMSSELYDLYQEVPTVEFENITTIFNGEILKFEDEDHYYHVLDGLQYQCNRWAEIFFTAYSNYTDEQLSNLADSLGFDEYQPLRIFESQFSFENNLRTFRNEQIEIWAEQGRMTNPPTDSLVNCPIEQTLLSKYYEVCVGDTIYQLRGGGIILEIPIEIIDQLTTIRRTDDIESLVEDYPNVVVNNGNSGQGCYVPYWFKEGCRINPNNANKNFTWSFLYKKAHVGHKYKTTITMTNYKLFNGKWKRDKTVSGLASYTTLYKYSFQDSSCTTFIRDSIYLESIFPTRHWSKRKKTIPVATIYDSTVTINGFYFKKIETESFRIDPQESWISCYYDGKKYRYNMLTLNETIEPIE